MKKVLLIICIIFLTACQPVKVEPTATPTIEPTATFIIVPTPTENLEMTYMSRLQRINNSCVAAMHDLSNTMDVTKWTPIDSELSEVEMSCISYGNAEKVPVKFEPMNQWLTKADQEMIQVIAFLRDGYKDQNATLLDKMSEHLAMWKEYISLGTQEIKGLINQP